ncbi:MAG: hypothetical protein CYPHOPRED_001624 [Cyphobasidiales sp. Tagirdzhanova-0007]|nr:MAG: hypothetical protein CYPHOPRED_001624 [Cyphobasidiales sp. Tagirdzhanova-0007]
MDLQAIYIRLHQERSDPDKHIAYAVEVHARNRTWTVWRRYSEFEALVRDLEQELTMTAAASKGKSSWRIPGLPPKRSLSILAPWRGTSEVFLEDRQAGLEQFLRRILGGTDELALACTESRAWRTFLGDAPSSGGAGGHLVKDAKNQASYTDFTASTWLDEYYALEIQAKEVQSGINKRNTLLDGGETTPAHQSSVHAKQQLAGVVSRLTVLAKGLDETKTAISEGELRRRTDMMAKLQDSAEVLGKLASAITTRPNISIASSGQSGASFASRDALLGAPSSTSKPITRVLGKQAHVPAQETEQTRVLDNSGLLQMQLQEIDQQDDRVTSLTAVIRRQKELATAIGVELEQQNELLDGLSNDVDRTGSKLGSAKKQLRRLE